MSDSEYIEKLKSIGFNRHQGMSHTFTDQHNTTITERWDGSNESVTVRPSALNVGNKVQEGNN